jgi:fructosamine-3-kinase
MIRGSLSARKVERRAPLLAGLHRVATGALAGLGLTMLGLSALTVHWQSRWARSYAELEASKTLEHRLQESSALLEQHHLGAIRRPGQLVPTSSERLIHLPEPEPSPQPATAAILADLRSGQFPSGY